MTKEIEEAIEVITPIVGKNMNKDERLNQLTEIMDEDDIVFVTANILSWQKGLIQDRMRSNDINDADQLIVTERAAARTKQFFECIPILDRIFVYENGVVDYQASLSEEDKKDIQNYVDERYKIKVRLGRDTFYI